jgi:natural product biosynthesis luciferase-like monooxygenase protein
MSAKNVKDAKQPSPMPQGMPPDQFSCFIMGAESLLIQCAEILLQRRHQILGVISSRKLIADWAKEKDIPLIEPGPHLADLLSRQPFDYLFSIANLSIIPKEVLALPRKGAVNFHDGPLPRYAGLHATSWALINNEKMHGITWHSMSGGVDKGDILKQRPVPIVDGETAFTLNAKCYEAAIDSFGELVDELAAGRLQSRRQNLAEQTYFSKYQRPAAACTLSWDRSADDISALVRALDFGPYANPLGLPKLAIGQELFIVPRIAVFDGASQAEPGTVTAIDSDSLRVAAAGKEVGLRELLTLDNHPVSIPDLVAKFGIHKGGRLTGLEEKEADALTALNAAMCRHEEFWLKRLGELESIEIPYANRNATSTDAAPYATASLPMPTEVGAWLAQRSGALSRGDLLSIGFAVYLARLSGNYAFDLGFGDCALRREVAAFNRFFSTHVPLRVKIDPSAGFDSALESLQAGLGLARKHKSYARDIALRYPELSARPKSKDEALLPVIVEQVESLDDYRPLSGSELVLLLSEDGAECRWVYNTAVLDRDGIASMQRQFITFLQNIAADGSRRIDESPLLTEAEHHLLITEWNKTELDTPESLCVHQLVEARAELAPDAVAVVFEDQQLTYRQLNRRANQLAHRLRRLSVGPETRVGIYMERSLDMIVGLLGILKAGAAYLPLDPTYPKERLAFMVEDAEAAVLLTQSKLLEQLPKMTDESSTPQSAIRNPTVVCIDADGEAISAESEENVPSGVTPDNLSYLIYTSGSTGKPKGVMVCHRNVVNFFAGMDERIPHDPPGVWLAVTSLSFDISVLELLWTLARGFKVIVYADKSHKQISAPSAGLHAHKKIDFSLFYFASDESEQGVSDKYRLLLEGARFADQHGFASVWTPERHFHAFGGLYPNPAVASAAIAAVTSRVGIRSGSCVLPLHHPIRVAEEWSLVDNLSRGRVGISFASGWQPNDFVLRPENHAKSKEIMFRDIEVVRKLWRGEAINFPGPLGKDVTVRTLPRPVQPELPVWITAAGNPETFRLAGAGGFNILTHLLGQSLSELGEKLAIYRKAWAENGHPGNGHVTLMLHTFVGDDLEQVRETVRKPMIQYLKSSVELIKQAAWHFPAFKQRADAAGKNPLQIFETEEISAQDMEALLNFSFERYFETSGLFGTPESCLQMVDALKGMEVDEIACLIDFGVSSETALEHLDHLKVLKELADPPVAAEDHSIPALIHRHRVTHMQCTPSMAGMLAVDRESRAALGTLQTFMVGGEAFPVALAAELKQWISGNIVNMYGPTETTIWSSTYAVNSDQDTVPIGRPIANTLMFVLDHHLQPVPIGVPGELFIGGAGVVRGYLNRPELTAERFIKNPLDERSGSPLYRTGDLVRYRPDGNLEFLGRVDHQVKIRGYRIELGEIESVLEQHPGVQRSIVVARGTEGVSGEKSLVAYLVANGKTAPSSRELHDFLLEKLPEFMVPSAFVVLGGFPLLPNGKVNRHSLPAPEQAGPELKKAFAAPSNPLEEALAGIWAEVLGLEQVGMHDNFFELGGHSLLAARLVSQVRDTFRVDLPLHSLFDAPTVAALARALIAREAKPGQTEKIAQILKRLAAMSPEEAQQMLQRRKSKRGVA